MARKTERARARRSEANRKRRTDKKATKASAAVLAEVPEALRQTPINLSETVDLLQQYLTESLCQEVFQATRTTERQREWSLYALARFWVHVTLRAPAAVRQMIEDLRKGLDPTWPLVSTTPQGLSKRCQTLSWSFFSNLFHGFLRNILPITEPVFAQEMGRLRQEFGEVGIIDGSRLDPIVHRLKILRDVRAVILPGCLLAVYDLFRGIPRWLSFDPDAAKSEMERTMELLPQLPKGMLLAGDRLFGCAKFFEGLAQGGLFGVVRRNHRLSLRRKKLLSRKQTPDGVLEDWLIEAGTGTTAPKQELRWIRLRGKGFCYEVLTNVLDPERLGPREALQLYRPYRWSVERMFFDLKVVLQLKRFYLASPQGVAIQVYAAALVYTAMRIVQGRIAKKLGVAPEVISPQKLFVRVADAVQVLLGAHITVRIMRKLNPGVRLREPDWRRVKLYQTTLGAIAVERRRGRRRKRRFCKARRHWKSFRHVRGGPTLIRSWN